MERKPEKGNGLWKHFTNKDRLSNTTSSLYINSTLTAPNVKAII